MVESELLRDKSSVGMAKEKKSLQTEAACADVEVGNKVMD